MTRFKLLLILILGSIIQFAWMKYLMENKANSGRRQEHDYFNITEMVAEWLPILCGGENPEKLLLYKLRYSSTIENRSNTHLRSPRRFACIKREAWSECNR